MTFEELLQNGYDWATYFYKLESRKRSPLEDVLLTSYNRIKGIKNVDICCCDLHVIKNCSPKCCPQMQCTDCSCIIRICKDPWFNRNFEILCKHCY